MSNWKEAMAESIAAHQDCRRASVENAQARQSCSDALLLKSEDSQAGMVHYAHGTGTFTVSNEHTFQTHDGLTEDEVLQAMQDLGVADTVWYRW